MVVLFILGLIFLLSLAWLPGVERSLRNQKSFMILHYSCLKGTAVGCDRGGCEREEWYRCAQV